MTSWQMVLLVFAAALIQQVWTECGQLPVEGFTPDWVVQIKVRYVENLAGSQHTCTGFFFRENMLLTAAHCFETLRSEADLEEFDLFLLFPGRSSAGFRPLRHFRLHRHPLYDKVDNDIAVLVVEDEEILALVAQPGFYAHQPCLAGPGEALTRADGRCFLLGFGGLRANSSSRSGRLRRVDLQLPSARECVEAINNPAKFNPRTMTCSVGSRRAGMGCKGDSGGPVICRLRSPSTTTARWFFYGFLIMASANCQKPSLNVHLRLDAYTDWLEGLESEPGFRALASSARSPTPALFVLVSSLLSTSRRLIYNRF